MFTRRNFVISAAAAAALFATPVLAADSKAFTMKAFQQAQNAGKSIVVEVHASWCPVCKKQAPVTAGLRTKAAYKNVQFFTVDFDTQKADLKALRVTKQSTLISFKGKSEKDRSTGVTDPAKIEALVKSSI
ncbi:MAG: thioredoxin family protein [Beijerinckiaceae bacterium]